MRTIAFTTAGIIKAAFISKKLTVLQSEASCAAENIHITGNSINDINRKGAIK
jgi:hypothetical protein